MGCFRDLVIPFGCGFLQDDVSWHESHGAIAFGFFYDYPDPMPTLASELKSNFDVTYKGVPSTMVYDLMNEVDILIVRHFGIRKKTIYLGLTEEDSETDLPAGAVWIETCRFWDKPSSTPNRKGGWKLDETNVDEMDVQFGDWRADGPAPPEKFMQSHNMANGVLKLEIPSRYTTLLVSAATNASPIVVTSSAAHGLADGDRVKIVNVEGNTAANVDGYAKVTGYSTTTFALYSDEDLTTAVAGNGVYTTGGLICCENSPMLELFTRWHITLDSSCEMPDTPFFKRLYTNGMKFLYASDRVHKDIPIYKPLFEDVIAEQVKITHQRAGRKPMKLNVVSQRPQPFVERTRW